MSQPMQVAASAAPASSGGFGASLRQFPAFRLFWLASFSSNAGQWVQSVALGWLALTMTDSPGFVGIVSFMAGSPFLVIAPLGGGLIDRLDRRKLMLACQALALTLALIVAIDVIGGWARPWHLLVFGALNGSLQAILNPTQQSIVPSLVARESLTNAIGLMSVSQNATRIVGPTLAGLVIALVGTGPAFFLQAAALAVAFSLVCRVPLPPRTSRAAGSRNPLEGLRMILARADLRGLFLLAAYPNLLIFPYLGFLNVFARDVLGIGAEGLGLLLAAPGFGALIGALTVAGKGRVENVGRLLLGSTTAYGAVIVCMALSRSLWLTLSLLVVAGFLGTVAIVGANATTQHRIDDDVRGRVMGAFLLTIGLTPIGALPMGLLAQRIGAPLAVSIFAAAGTLLTVLLGISNRTLRSI